MKLALLVFFTALTSFSYAQQTRIQYEFRDATFEQFVTELESKSSYHFYFKRVETDSIRISIQGNDDINTIVTKALETTDLKFAVFNKAVFITSERLISTSLPPDFFEEEKKHVSRTQPEFDFSDYEKREKKQKSLEEKLYNIGVNNGSLKGDAVIAGHVVNAANGEPVIGASIFVEDLSSGVATDPSGFYSLTLPKGKHTLRINSLGMKTTRRQVMVYGNGNLSIEIDEEITALKEVVIESEHDAKVMNLQMGMERLDIKTMKQMPAVLGETDVLKVLLTLPGVQSVGEGASGVNIRGGATSQNLILFNDAVVYNPSHLFGFFSAFNPDILKGVELFKSGVTADYGGRLSSVLDITSREGNLKKFSASGGISPITGRLMLEGPIIKDKTSFLISGRTTYSDWLLRRLDSPQLANSQAAFYDLNFGVLHKLNDRNSLQLSIYKSADKFTLNSDTLYSYGEQNGSLKYKHVFSNKIYGIFTGSVSNYKYEVTSDENPPEAFVMDFDIKQVSGKADFSYFQNSRQTITAGVQVTQYGVSPGSKRPEGIESIVENETVQNEKGMESAVYIGENFELNSKISIYGGLRYSFYRSIGPRTVYNYGAGGPRTIQNITDTVSYNQGETIASYHGAEPRFSVRYLLGKNGSIKVSYNRMRQYIQMLSNTTAIAPTDIWKLSDSYIQPQIGDQISLGYYKNIKGGKIEFSLEGYYKKMKNVLDYKDGAVLLLNNHLETDALGAEGKAYGAEVMFKKPAGKLNGWVSYTYSRSLLKTNSTYSSEIVNSGNFYPSNYDKPHAANFISNYKVSRRFNFSLNFTYSTGRPITIPLAKYEINGTSRTLYSDRNEYRIPDYFRTDISINFEGNHKIKKLAHSSWTLAVYNATGRANAYSVFFVSENGVINGYKLSVFAKPIPTLTYNFRF